MRFGFIFYSISKLIDGELQWTLYAMIAVKHGTKRLTIRCRKCGEMQAG